jgi:hypothetical protein
VTTPEVATGCRHTLTHGPRLDCHDAEVDAIVVEDQTRRAAVDDGNVADRVGQRDREPFISFPRESVATGKLIVRTNSPMPKLMVPESAAPASRSAASALASNKT